MSWSPEDDLDEHGHTPRQARAATMCQCADASEWPGQCPGPALCPLQQSDDKEDGDDCAPLLYAEISSSIF